MAYIFGDSFDLYATAADAIAGYWDSGGVLFTLVAGRFSGGQALRNSTAGSWFVKSSGANDSVHHLVCAFQQTAAISGTNNGLCLQLGDGATLQCSIVFRSDGAILLTSGASTGTVLATYTGAFVQNAWTAFEFEVVVNNTTGSFTVRKNGNTSNDFTLGSLNTRGGTANNYANRLTVANQVNVVNHLLDDLLWRSDASSVPWVGDVRCYTRMPASDAAVQFAPSASAVPLTPFAASGNAAVTSNLARYTPFTSPCSGAIGSVTIPVTTASTANFKCAIYASSGTAPTTFLGSATPVSAPGIGTATFTFTTPVPVTQATQYWVAYNVDASSGQVTFSGGSPGVSGSSTYASWPVNNPAGLSANTAPCFTLAITVTSGTNYGFVSEPQQDGANSYAYDSTVGHADFYNIAALAVTPGSVVAVTTRGFIQKSDAGSRSGAVQLKSGSTTVASTTTAASTTFAWLWRTDTVDPATSAAWTATGVNNVTIGPIVIS